MPSKKYLSFHLLSLGICSQRLQVPEANYSFVAPDFVLHTNSNILQQMFHKRAAKWLLYSFMILKIAQGAALKIIKEENRKERFFSLLFCYYVLATSIMALILPLLVAVVFYLKGHGFMDNLQVPLKASYNTVLDPKSFQGYLLAYIWNLIVIFFNFQVTVGNDTLFSWLTYNVAAQFRILNLNFKTTALSARMRNDENIFINLLKSHIKYHQRVIELADNFNEVFKVTVFFTYAISFLQISCLLFQIARADELSTLIFHLLFMISVSLQMMLYCRGGQIIIDKSSSVAVTIYEHFQWHEMSVKSKKLLLLSMIRAKKPCILTGVFFIADLPLFLWVYKTSGSFFALLKSMEL